MATAEAAASALSNATAKQASAARLEKRASTTPRMLPGMQPGRRQAGKCSAGRQPEHRRRSPRYAGPMSMSAIQRCVRARPKLACAAACLLLAASVSASARAASEPDLGAPSFAAYCKAIGLVDARFTSGPSKAWGCLHADGTITPLDVQAACEFTYTERPLLARELVPGAIYTWHCLQSAASGGATPGPGVPTSAQMKAALLAALTPHGRAARIGALLKHGYSARFHALAAGRVRISWYLVPRGAHLARSHPSPVLVATGTRSIAGAGAATIRISLSSKGRHLLARSHRLRLTARGTFAPVARPAVSATKSK